MYPHFFHKPHGFQDEDCELVQEMIVKQVLNVCSGHATQEHQGLNIHRTSFGPRKTHRPPILASYWLVDILPD